MRIDREDHDPSRTDSGESRRRMARASSGFPSRGYRNPNPNPNRRIPPSSRFPDSGRRRNSDRTHHSRRRFVSTDPDYDEGCFSDELSYRDYQSRRRDYHPAASSNSEDERQYFYNARSHLSTHDRSFFRNDNIRTDQEPCRSTTDSCYDSRNHNDNTRLRFRRDTRSYSDVVTGRHRGHSPHRHGDDCYANRPADRRYAEHPVDRRRSDRRTDRSSDTHTHDSHDNNSDHRRPDVPPRAPAPNANFAQLSRIFFNMIQICHHLENISTTGGKKGPLTICRTVDYLHDLIRPAMPNSTTMLALEGNARQWSVVTLEILKQHYTDCLTVLLDELSNKNLQGWRAPFQVAIRWAFRKFKRLRQLTIEQTEKHIQSQVRATDSSEEGEEEGPPGPPSPPSPSSPPPRPRPHRATAATKSAPNDPPPTPVQSAPSSSPKSLKHRIKTTCPPMTSHPATNLATQEPAPSSNCEVTVQLPSLGDEDTYSPDDPYDSEDYESDESDNASDSQDAEEADHADAPDDSPLLITDSSDSPLLALQSSSPKGKVNTHPITNHKMIDWTLTIHKKILLIGDSNVSKIPQFNIDNLQIECYPEANFRHISEVLKKSVSQTKVETVILSIGFHSRTQYNKATLTKQFQAAIRSAFNILPGTKLYIPLIHIPVDLPPSEKANLCHLNDFILDFPNHLLLIDSSKFQTTAALLWTAETARIIFNSWMKQLKLSST